MYKQIIAAILLTLSANINAAPGDSAHVFILSGQSNMAQLSEGTFESIMNEVLGPDNVIVVKYALGGQPIMRWDRDWVKDPTAPDPVYTNPFFPWDGTKGDLYDSLMKYVQPAVDSTVILTATFYWMQGEADAATEIQGGAVYGASLQRIISRMEGDLGVTDMNVVMGRISDAAMPGTDRAAANPDWIEVREAQVALAESDPDYGWFDTDRFNDPNDDLHYPAYGRELLVQGFADKSLELLQADTDEITGTSWYTGLDSAEYALDDSEAEAVFNDDFADSNLAVDPDLPNGLGWEQPAQGADFYVDIDTLTGDAALASPTGRNTTQMDVIIRSTQGDTGRAWRNYAVDYTVKNISTTQPNGTTGLTLLMNGYGNYYVFSTSSGMSTLLRVMTDSSENVTTTGLFSDLALSVAAGASKHYRVVAEPHADSIVFYFGSGTSADEAKKIKRRCVDYDPDAVALFGRGGGIGFFKNYRYIAGQHKYDDISVKVFSFEGDSTPVSAVTVPAAPAVPAFSISSSVFTDRLTVRNPAGSHVGIYNAAGELILEKNNKKFTWNAINAPAGAYYVRTLDNGQAIQRIIKID